MIRWTIIGLAVTAGLFGTMLFWVAGVVGPEDEGKVKRGRFGWKSSR